MACMSETLRVDQMYGRHLWRHTPNRRTRRSRLHALYVCHHTPHHTRAAHTRLEVVPRLLHSAIPTMPPAPYTTPSKGSSKSGVVDGASAADGATTGSTSDEDGIPAQPAGFIYDIPQRSHAAYPHPILSAVHGVTTAWWLFSVLLLASLFTNVLQLLSHTLLFLPRHTRFAIAQQLADVFWLLFPFATEVHSSIPLLLTGNPPLATDSSALLIGNHAPGLDFPVGCSVSFLPGGPGVGRLLVLMKQSLSFYPIVGWTHVLQGSLFLTRRWESDKRQIDSKMHELLQPSFPRPFWLGVYPEGTRITPAKKAASQAFSRERHLPLFHHVLFPRTKGFTYVLSALRPTLTAVYNATTSYSGGGLFISDVLFRGQFRSQAIHVHMTRTPVASLPADAEGQNEWLYSAFKEKDKLLSYFQQYDRFPVRGASEVYIIPAGRFTRLTTVFVGWSALMSGGLWLAFGWWLGVVGVVMTTLTVLRPMLLGGLWDVIGDGSGPLSDIRRRRELTKTKRKP